MNSIIESEYIKPTRPYSQNELKYNRECLSKKLRLGNHVVYHDVSKHFYRARVNSRKEHELIDTGNSDVGNCSVSWKISKTPEYLLDRVHDIVDTYEHNFRTEPEQLTHILVDIESVFYNWLYDDNNTRRVYN